MDFLKVIQSLDELLYEIMSWLVFYPLTLWRALVRPLAMMDYSDIEQREADNQQYTDTLSPPLFLLLSLLLGHTVQLVTIGEDGVIESKAGLSALVSDQESLLVLTLATFSLVPLLLAVRLVRARGEALDRDSLRAPFYAQCYVVAPLALLMTACSIGVHLSGSLAVTLGWLALFIGAWVWFGLLQSLWFAQHLQSTRWRGFLNASRALAECVAALIGVGLLFR